ncbi:MAG: hypothetical protein R8M45_03520, partial [Ghiorsea sp.]
IVKKLFAELKAFIIRHSDKAYKMMTIDNATLAALARQNLGSMATKEGSAAGLSNPLMESRAAGYTGEDAGEAKEWLQAKAKGLDMSKEARMKRAKAMGFDVDTVMYHGTNDEFDEFNLTYFGKTDDGWYGKGIYLSGTPNGTSGYSGGEGGNTIAVYTSVKDTFVTDLASPMSDEYVEELLSEGVDSIAVHTTVEDGLGVGKPDEFVVFNPSHIRSTNAAFDPDYADSSNLLHSKQPAKQLLAPNGKPSKLNARQHAQVRTLAFKKWFGDWESNPENASKVVDENGEPRVVYHGTSGDFNSFSSNTAIWGAINKTFASEYAEMRGLIDGGDNVIPSFMRANSSFDGNRLQKGSNKIDDFFDEVIEQADKLSRPFDDNEMRRLTGIVKLGAKDNGAVVNYSAHQFWNNTESLFGREGAKALSHALKMVGFDSILFNEESIDGQRAKEKTVGVLNSNQIKSATGNNGEFDAENNDIRFSRSTPEQYAKDIKSESEALLNRATEGKGSNTLVSGIHHLISYAYYRPVQIIRDFGTPTARLMMDMVYKEEKNDARVLDDHDFIQRRQQKNGEFMQKVSKLIDKIDGTRAQRKKKQASIIDVLNGGTTYESMKPLAKEFRALFDEMLEYQKEAGLEIKPLDHYFPRVYDVSKLTKLGGKLAFVNMLNKAGYNGDKIWANIVENDGLYQINDTTDR